MDTLNRDGNGNGNGNGNGYGYGDGYGCGYGDGYGDGNGNGNGYGYGDGYGCGYGDGNGNGNGYGYGDGYGCGCGYGNGNGYGDGDGDGYGCGYGYGNGYGDGYGCGCGYGYGNGNGYGKYWRATIESYVARLPVATQRTVYALQARGATIALWRSDQGGRACNGGSSARAVHAGLREQIAGPLAICTARALHATYQPHRYSGGRLWLVALFGEVQERDDKLGALEREIITEII